MRILYLSAHFPHGRSYGSQIRALGIGRLLKKCGDVDLYVATRKEPTEDTIEQTSAEFNLLGHALIQDCPFGSIKNRLRYITDPRYLNIGTCQLMAADIAAIEDRLSSYDVIWVNRILTANSFRRWIWPKSIIDVDDIPSQSFRSRAGGFRPTRRWLRDVALSQLWRRHERLLWDRFNLVGFCSETDRRYMGSHQRSRVIPNGFFPQDAVERNLCSAEPRIGFIGLMRYRPNDEGVRWFLTNVWPIIKKRMPTARFRIVGDGCKPDIATLGKDIDILGWVNDPKSEISTWHHTVVPVRQGAGTRVKIAEAFGRGCPVVATSLGAFGYNVTSGVELILADSPQQFADSCVYLVQNTAAAEKIARAARARFQNEWTWDAIGRSVREIIQFLAPDSSISAI